jgi:polyhydroxybutyrate depolymerase
MKTHLISAAFAATILACGIAHASDKTETITINGYDRTYTYHMPSHGEGKLPIVLVLPESGVSGADAIQNYRWSSLGDKKGFIAVGLDALPVDPTRAELFQTNPSFWSDGSGRGNAKRGHLDDTAYVDAVLDDLADRVKVDPKRIYAVGFGNGGSMVNELGQRLSGKLAAIAAFAGHAWSPDTPMKPLSVLLLYGASDPVDPVTGGMGTNVWTHGFDPRPPAQKTVDTWVAALKCPGDGVKAEDNGLTAVNWDGCAGGTAVTYGIIPAQGHHWPGGDDDMMPSIGPNSDFDADGFIWAWLAKHPKN